MPDNPDEALQRARQRLAAAEAATGGGQFGTPDYSVYEELAAVERWGQGAVDEVHAARRALAAAEAGALNAALGRAPRRGRLWRDNLDEAATTIRMAILVSRLVDD